MKKIYIIISVFLISLFCCSFGLVAYADSDIVTGTLYYSPEDVLQGVTPNRHYIYIKYQSNESIYGQNDYIRYYTECYLFDTDNITVTHTNNVYHFNCNGMSIYQRFHTVHVIGNDEHEHEHQSCLSQTASRERTSIEVDIDNHTVTIVDGLGRTERSSVVLDDFDTDLEDYAHFFDDISISLFPELSSNFDYTVEYGGSSMPINLLQIDIKNNTDHTYQYCILIQPSDSFLEYDDHSNSKNLSVFWGDSPITYCMFKDEWFYCPFAFDQGYELINAPCCWHLLSSKGFKREQIYFEQMQLKKGINYTFKVLVFDISGKSDINYPWYTASSLIDVVYSKDFSVKSDTIFNANQNANGCYSFDNTIPLDTQFDKVKAVYNKDTGNIDVLQNGQFGNIYKKDTSNGGSLYSSNSSASSSLNNLFLYSSSYLVLCNRVLYYFPDWVNYCLLAGLSGLLLIFILKKL